MRYEEWDFLLFPAGIGEGSHVPLKEFHTACCSVQEASLTAPETVPIGLTPLMTCFVPSLPHNAPFNVSIHSWARKPRSKFAVRHHFDDDMPSPPMWMVKVIVDNVCVNITTLPHDANWPQIISVDMTGGTMGPLRFPPFHTAAVTEKQWDAVDETGRIKVELSEGFNMPTDDHHPPNFRKMANHVYVNFQPAPLEILDRAGISWPNHNTFKNPKLHFPGHVTATHHSQHAHLARNGHQRISSAGSGYFSSPTGVVNWAQFAPSAAKRNHMASTRMPPPPFHDGSRSTSAYSFVAPDFLPPMPGTHKMIARPVEVRLPSEQINKLVNALHGDPFTGGATPVPAHTHGSQAGNGLVSSDMTTLTNIPTSPVRRPASRGGNNATDTSDVSMHAGCISYPTCISEEANGSVTHVNPEELVCRDKERSDSVQNRDPDPNNIDDGGPATVAEPTLANVAEPPKPDAGKTANKETKSTGNKKRSRSTSNTADKESPEKPTRKLRSRTVGR